MTEALQMAQGGRALPGRTIEEISADIRMRVQHMARDYIAIGRDLIEAKELLGHGRFLPWLREMGFGVSAADKWMRLAGEIDMDSPLAELPQSKVMALLSLPAGEREQFAQDNAVESKSAAEIKRLIQEKTALEKDLNDARNNWKTYQDSAIHWKHEADYRAERIEELQNAEPRTVTVHEVPEDYQQLKMAAAHQAADLQEAIEAAEEAERRAADAEARLARAQLTGGRDRYTEIQDAANSFLMAANMLPWDRVELGTEQKRRQYELMVKPIREWVLNMQQALEFGPMDAEGAVL